MLAAASIPIPGLQMNYMVHPHSFLRREHCDEMHLKQHGTHHVTLSIEQMQQMGVGCNAYNPLGSTQQEVMCQIWQQPYTVPYMSNDVECRDATPKSMQCALV